MKLSLVFATGLLLAGLTPSAFSDELKVEYASKYALPSAREARDQGLDRYIGKEATYVFRLKSLKSGSRYYHFHRDYKQTLSLNDDPVPLAGCPSTKIWVTGETGKRVRIHLETSAQDESSSESFSLVKTIIPTNAKPMELSKQDDRYVAFLVVRTDPKVILYVMHEVKLD